MFLSDSKYLCIFLIRIHFKGLKWHFMSLMKCCCQKFNFQCSCKAEEPSWKLNYLLFTCFKHRQFPYHSPKSFEMYLNYSQRHGERWNTLAARVFSGQFPQLLKNIYQKYSQEWVCSLRQCSGLSLNEEGVHQAVKEIKYRLPVPMQMLQPLRSCIKKPLSLPYPLLFLWIQAFSLRKIPENKINNNNNNIQF